MPNTPRHLALLTIMWALVPGWIAVSHADQGNVVTLFGGADLNGWKVEGADVAVDSAVLRVRQGPGWIRSEKPRGDFVLRLEVRLTGPNAQAGIFVRAYPATDQTKSPASVGYEIPVKDTAPARGEWHRYAIDCTDTTAKVTVDGAQTTVMKDLDNPSGYLALRTQSGIAEFRNIELETPRIPGLGPGEQIIEMADQRRLGVIFTARPLLPNPPPQYTSEALEKRIQGSVMMSAVVAPDGAAHDIVVIKSLDPKYGLDQSAVNALRKSRFTPAMLNGRPVAVRIMVENNFSARF